MRYGFTFDASACTGCKSCQVACKDKNALPPGVLWRRVYEVTGGSWQQQGAAWTNTVFAYNVSVGCNHCEDPACASACPTGAYRVRDDGIVVQEASKCLGCQYCAWACPYSAPQYSPELGRTTKCDFCCDLIDQGVAPACVNACPMRALDFTKVDDGRPIATVRPFPFPSVSNSTPSLAIKAHPAMLNALPKAVANREEIHPSSAATAALRFPELPLVAFTLLGQTAAGMALISLVAGWRSGPVHSAIGVLLAAAALVSLLHLGKVTQAWRAPAQVRTSPLSREILMLGAFAGAWLLALAAPVLGHTAMAATGAVFVYSMGEVYRLDAVPGWNRWRTHFAFAATALLLAGIALVFVVAATSSLSPALTWFGILLAVAAAAAAVGSRSRFYERIHAKSM